MKKLIPLCNCPESQDSPNPRYTDSCNRCSKLKRPKGVPQRCTLTGVSIPECGCKQCGLALVERARREVPRLREEVAESLAEVRRITDAT